MKPIKLKFIGTLFLLFSTFIAVAQETFPDDTQDVPAATIDKPFFSLVLVALILGFYFLKKHKKVHDL